MSSLRDRINSVLARHYPQTTGYHDELTDWCQCGLRRDHVADAVIAALTAEPSDAGDRLDCIGRWMHPGLWSGLDGRREAFIRILKGEIVEPPEWARK